MEPQDIVIRDEVAADKDFIEQLILLAFNTDDEAMLILSLRPTVEPLISLVAEEGGRILGHILLTEIAIRTESGKVPSVGVVVLAIHPMQRGHELGRRLLEEALMRCTAAGASHVFALTEPNYYTKHGFLLAEDIGFTYKWQEYASLLTVKELRPGSLGQLEGVVDFQPDTDSIF